MRTAGRNLAQCQEELARRTGGNSGGSRDAAGRIIANMTTDEIQAGIGRCQHELRRCRDELERRRAHRLATGQATAPRSRNATAAPTARQPQPRCTPCGSRSHTAPSCRPRNSSQAEPPPSYSEATNATSPARAASSEVARRTSQRAAATSKATNTDTPSSTSATARPDSARSNGPTPASVSYTHLTLPTKRIV